MNKEGARYEKQREIKKDTLHYITQKMLGEISYKKEIEQDEDFTSVYQKVKRMKALIIRTYPFEDLKDIKKSRHELERLIRQIYDGGCLYDILKKMDKGKELDLHEYREYFRSVEYCIGKSYLDKLPLYRKLKKEMIIIDKMEAIQQQIESDFDMIEEIYISTKNFERVKHYLDAYRDTMLINLNKLRNDISMEYCSLRSDERVESPYVEFDYDKVEEELAKNINFVNTHIIGIDCKGKTMREIRQEGFLEQLPIDEVMYINEKIEIKNKKKR